MSKGNPWVELNRLGKAKVNVTLSVEGAVNLASLAFCEIQRIREGLEKDSARKSEIAATLAELYRGGLHILMDQMEKKQQFQPYLRLRKKIKDEEYVEK